MRAVPDPVVSDGMRFVYERRPGSDCNLVLLHGIGTSLDYWARVLPLVPDRFTLMCPDLPGSGWSEFTGDDYDIAGIARQLRTLLDPRLTGSTVLVGHSLGALVAIELAAQRPASYTKLVLVDPVLFDVERVLTDLSAFLKRPHLSATVISQLLGVLPSGRLSAQILKSAFLRRLLLADQVGDGAQVDPAVLAQCLAGTRGWPRFKIRDVLKAAGRVHLSERLTRARTPFSLIKGTKDPLSTPTDLKRLESFDGFDSIIEIEGTGHSPMLDKPAPLMTAIIEASAFRL